MSVHIPSIKIAGNDIKLADQITSLRVIIDSTLTFDPHVTALCKACHFHLRSLRYIRHSLSTGYIDLCRNGGITAWLLQLPAFWHLIIIIIYFCLYEVLPFIPWTTPIQVVNQAPSYHPPHKPWKSSFSFPYISPLSPLFYRPIPDAQTTSICYASITTSAIACTPRRLYKSTLPFLSFSDTPHIYLTIIHSALSRLCRFASFIAQDSVPCVNALWTQALYIFSFTWYDAPRAVRIGLAL